MKMIYPDYSNNLTCLANSIAKAFGVDTKEKNTLPICDEYLKKDYKNVVLIVLDGMGQCIMDRNLNKDGFFLANTKAVIHSVFPPTTVSATTSLNSGLDPCQHGWLGWDCYFRQLDENVTVFLNTKSETDILAANYPVANTILGYEGILKKIENVGENSYAASPYMTPFPDNFQRICQRIEKLCQQDGKKYIYAYWTEPDGVMHKYGCYSTKSKETLKKLENQVVNLCKDLEDTLVMVTADHGHVDIRGVCITHYPKIMECLLRMPSMEPRAVNFFIKEGWKEQFEMEFVKEFGNEFLLFTKSEVMKKHLFGYGIPHKELEYLLGDYLAIGVSDLAIFNNMKEKQYFKGMHSGLTKDEIEIPLIIFET